MIVGLGDDSAPAALGPDESCCSTPEKRKKKALKHLGRAHQKGALAALAAGQLGGLGDLGEVEAGDLWPNPTEVDAKEADFDARVNAWQVDYQAAYASLPAALTQQIDAFLARWQDRPTFWVFSATHLKLIIDAEAEFNRYRDQIAALGHPSAVQAATVSVNGTQVRSDQIPPGSSTLDKIESIVKWGGIALGAFAAYRIASTLGIVSRVGRLVGGGGGGGGGGVRRYGSARRQ